jgi:hypothetical protein
MRRTAQPSEEKYSNCRKRRSVCDGQPGVKCSACRKYKRSCSHATTNNNDSLAHPLTLLTPSFLDSTKAFYQLGALISCFVPSHLRLDTNNKSHDPPQTQLNSSQQTLPLPTTFENQRSQTSTSHQLTPIPPPTMGSTKAFRQTGATNSDGSKMLSYKHSTTNPDAKAPKSKLNPQGRLQDASLTHWHQPIDEALDLHLHGRLTVTDKTLAPDSWTKWTKNYCSAMSKLVRLVHVKQANELLTTKLAAVGFPDRDIGIQPHVVNSVVRHVKKRLGLVDGAVGKKAAVRRGGKAHKIVRGANARSGGGKGQRNGRQGKI